MERFRANGYPIQYVEELQPALIKKALQEYGVSVIICPIDYSENMTLTHKLGELNMPS